MLDRRDENKDFDLQEVMSPIMQQFLEIETCMECSALGNTQVEISWLMLDTCY